MLNQIIFPIRVVEPELAPVGDFTPVDRRVFVAFVVYDAAEDVRGQALRNAMRGETEAAGRVVQMRRRDVGVRIVLVLVVDGLRRPIAERGSGQYVDAVVYA